MKILLDTNILLLEPEILAKKKADVDLVIPKSILLEFTTALLSTPKGQSLLSSVDDAIAEGKAQAFKPSRQLRISIPSGRLSGVDIDLLNSAQEIIDQQEQDVAIATNDKDVLKGAKQLGIRTYNLEQLRNLFKDDVEIDQQITQTAQSWSSDHYRHLIFGVIIGVILTFLANITWTYFDKIVSTVTIWGTIIGILAIGLGIYAVRGRYRLPYGVFEFLFGFVAAVRVFWPEFKYEEIKATDILQVIGGLYIMVRGQDNIGRALKYTKFEHIWKRFSGEKDSIPNKALELDRE